MTPFASALRPRLWWCGLGLLGLLAAGAGRLFEIQVVRHEHYRDLRDRQAFTEERIPAERGRVYLRGGVLAAISREQAPSVFADPQSIDDPARTASVLASLLELPASELLERLERARALGRRFTWVKRLVTPAERAQVRFARLPGIDVREEADRAYPRGPLAGHVIGFVGREQTGLEGLEARFESLLAGTPGVRRYARDALGHPIVEPDSAHTPPVPGCDVTLTIDGRHQELLERELADACQRWDAASGMGLVLEVATGAVVAWAQVPGVDPNDPGAAPPEARRTRALTDPFEPGSAMKMFTVGTALRVGAVTPDTRIDCANGAWAYRRRRIEDFHPYGVLTVREVLMKSSNIGSVRCVLAMADPWGQLQAELAPFGFGQRTGIELAGEAAGYVGAADPSKRSVQTPVSVTMGYECMVTSLQLAAAANTIANDGVWVAPHVVARIESADGAMQPLPERPPPRRVWPVEHARLMRTLLAGVVSDTGTARLAQVKDLAIGGKTSTVKKLQPNGTYDSRRSRCLFVGFAPADRPVYTILVLVDEPGHGTRKEQTGGKVAAPAAARVLAALFDRPLPDAPGPAVVRSERASSASDPRSPTGPAPHESPDADDDGVPPPFRVQSAASSRR